MNEYVKKFFHRGLVFSGFGPIVLGIVYFVLSKAQVGFSLTGGEVLLAIVSTYLLAFVQAGASVFHQIEEWSLAKSLLCHLSLLYLAYVLCYVTNAWIPFEPMVLLIFTGIFIAGYLVIWASVLLGIKAASRKFNEKLKH